MKSVATALLRVAFAADVAVPVLIAPALALAVSTAVHAETSPQDVRQEVVRFDDLNLASPAGAAAFRLRLKGAAEYVCGPRADPRSFTEAADYQSCMAKAVQAALSGVPQAQKQAARTDFRAG